MQRCRARLFRMRHHAPSCLSSFTLSLVRASSQCVRLRGARATLGLSDADLAALLGALSLNTQLEELDLCANPAPSSEWASRALADATRRERVAIRHHRTLPLPGVVRAAPSLQMALMRGITLPSWLAPHAAGDPSASPRAHEEYCLPVPVRLAAESSSGSTSSWPAAASNMTPAQERIEVVSVG